MAEVIDISTQKIIAKIKRLATVKETDVDIIARIEDSFSEISSVTNYTNMYFSSAADPDNPSDTIVDIINPLISSNTSPIYSSLREAIVYCVLKDYSIKNIQTAAGKSVIVKSGRDSVDTTKSAKDISLAKNIFEEKFLSFCEDIKKYMEPGASN